MVLTAIGIAAATRSAADGEGENRRVGAARQMTPEVLAEICKERSMWTLPQLNTQLYLNLKGFDCIGGLENYTAVKTLHLGNNCISKIEGLERMSELRSLHLEGNRISCIENLKANLELRQLNLEGNCISHVTGLANHTKLEQINLARNIIADMENVKELQHLQKLSNVDVSHNQIESVDGVIEFWTGLAESVRLIRFHGNPCVRNIEHYRKRLINALPHLSYLDERPVFPIERKSCKAWAEGGMEAMHEAKRQHVNERNRMQFELDPERKEILSRNRKLALERIEREARERAEQEQVRHASCKPADGGGGGSTDDAPGGSAQAGDQHALDEYATKWRTKVRLYGADGVREQVAKEADSAFQRPAAPAGHSFAPPSRVAGGATAAVGGEQRHVAPAEAAGQATAVPSSARRGYQRPVDAADFRVTQAARPIDAVDEFHDRQFTVWGDDLETQLGSSAAPAAQPAPGRRAAAGGGGGAGGGRGSPAAAGGGEVMPMIWERNQELTNAEEMRCIELNLTARSRAAEQLTGLD